MHLEIRSPDGTARRVEVTGPVVVGRGEDCDIQLLEVKASRRHLRLSREPGEPWVVEDLESSNGTILGETRVLRARLAHGDLLRVGDTVLAVEDPPAAGLVGGRLTLRAVAGLGGDAPSAAAPVLPAAEEPASEAAAQEPAPEAVAGGPRVRPLDMRSFGRGLTLAIVGLLVVAGVQATLGAKGARARQDTEARSALQDLLASADVDAQAFERLAGEWLRRYPDSPDRGALERHLEAARSRGGVRADVRDRLESLMQRLGSTPEARARSELLALSRALPEDGSLQEQVRLAFVELDRRRAAYERIEGERVCAEAEQLVGEGLPGVAWRRLNAFRAARAKLSPELAARLSAGEDAALAAVRTLAAQTLAAAQSETDLSRRRALLQAAWPGLAGTPEQPAIADALRYASQPPRGPSGRPSAGPSTGPDPGEALLAQAAEAERLFGARRWTQARTLFEALRAKPQVPALLQQEWALRSADIERLLGLAAALGQAAAAQPPPAKKLSVGAVTVTADDDKGVT